MTEFIYRFRMWLFTWLDNLAMWINPIEPVPESVLKKSADSIQTRVRARLEYPCSYCKGEGTIEMNDEDWLTCPDCLGTGIDIVKAQQ